MKISIVVKQMAVIEHMGEKIKSFAGFQQHFACGTSRIGPVSSETQACLMDVSANLERIIALTPESALKEFEQKIRNDERSKMV
mgnify:CR=1 FL=1